MCVTRKLARIKDMKPCVDYAETNGWEIRVSKNNHIQFRKPNRKMVTTSWSASDGRAHKNCLAELKRVDRLEITHYA